MTLRIILLTAVLALAAARADAVSCGATITADTTLATELFCPSHSPALIVKGPAKLDMAGHRLIGCASDGIGIDVVGAGATVKNGAVVDCDTGVRVRGSGKHRVENVVVLQAYRGFLITSGKNQIVRTAAIQSGYVVGFPTGPADGNVLNDNLSVSSGEYGFLIEGDNGSYDRNISTGAAASGFMILGSWNSLRRNIARTSHEYGFEIDGDVNRFERNLAQGSGEAGFSMYDGEESTGNRMMRNVALTSEGDGYDLGAGTVFMNNTAIANGDRGIRSRHPGTSIIESVVVGESTGIFVSGDDSIVRRNRALGNGAGIVIGDGTDISVLKNVAIGNYHKDVVDSAACAGHDWDGNIFSTADPVCP